MNCKTMNVIDILDELSRKAQNDMDLIDAGEEFHAAMKHFEGHTGTLFDHGHC